MYSHLVHPHSTHRRQGITSACKVFRDTYFMCTQLYYYCVYMWVYVLTYGTGGGNMACCNVIMAGFQLHYDEMIFNFVLL